MNYDPACLPPPDPDNPRSWDWGFHRVISLFQQPIVGTSLLAIGIFFLIIFLTRALLAPATLFTLGLTLTFAVLAFMALVICILVVI